MESLNLNLTRLLPLQSNLFYYYHGDVVLLGCRLTVIGQSVRYGLDYFFTGFIFVLANNLL
jgi:hypothetical protein